MRYLNTFNENMSLAKSIIGKKMEAFDKLKTLLTNNLGYIGKFTEYLMNENIPYSELEELYKKIIGIKKKNYNIDISNLKYEQVIDKIQKINNDISINKLISQFPSEQKKLSNELLSQSVSYYNIILQTSKKDNLDALISKISRYKTSQDLINAFKIFGKDSFNDKDEIKKYLSESKSSQIVLEKNNIMIVKVGSIEDIQKLGSDTSWCILREHLWKSYTTNRYQYILYDFDKDQFDPKFKIGFTMNKDFTIYTAHDILDTGSTTQLNKIIFDNEIKYSELIPKSEIIEVTEEIIARINSRTPINKLKSYSMSVDVKLIPSLIAKIMNRGELTLTLGTYEVLNNLINKFFSDYELVKVSDIEKLEPRLLKIFDNLRSNFPRLLKNKFVDTTPNFDKLEPSIIVKMLDYWEDDKFIRALSNSGIIDKFIFIPGSDIYNLNYADELKYKWDKTHLIAISDKVNKLWESGKWDDVLSNNYTLSNFACVYILLNYALNRANIVDKSALKLVNTNNKIQYAYLLKLPIDISNNDYVKIVNKWAVPYIVKKDYTSSKIYIDNLNVISLLLEHLAGHKLVLKISKALTVAGRSPLYFNDSDKRIGKQQLLELIKEVSSKKRRAGDSIISKDGLIKVEVY